MPVIEKVLRLNDARKHSIRRTSIDVYADCLVPLGRISAITKHTSQTQLLEYIGNFNSIVDSSVPTGGGVVLLKAVISTRRSSARGGAASLRKWTCG